MVNALSLIKLLQFSEESIRKGKVSDNDQVFSELRKNIDNKKNTKLIKQFNEVRDHIYFILNS